MVDVSSPSGRLTCPCEEAGGLAGVVCPAIAAFCSGAALAETGESPSLRCAALPPGSRGLGSARRQPSRPRERVSVGRDCFVCRFLAQVDAHWQTHPHLAQFSQHPQTRHTEHRAPPSIHASRHHEADSRAHSSGAPHPLTDALACLPLRTHFPLSAHTPALRVHPRTASCTCTHNLTHSHSTRARAHAHSHSHIFFPHHFFFSSVKRQLQARRPRQRWEGSSREGVATASC